jgi:hypothetical protein
VAELTAGATELADVDFAHASELLAAAGL